MINFKILVAHRKDVINMHGNHYTFWVEIIVSKCNGWIIIRFNNLTFMKNDGWLMSLYIGIIRQSFGCDNVLTVVSKILKIVRNDLKLLWLGRVSNF
jgi:hypothetical protein